MIDSAPASFTVIFTDDARAPIRKLFQADVEGASERLDKKIVPALLGIQRCVAHVQDGLIDVEDYGPHRVHSSPKRMG